MKIFEIFRKDAKEENTFLFILVALGALIVIGPFLEEYTKLNYMTDILFTTVMIFGVTSVTRRKHAVAIALSLIIPVLLISWGDKIIAMPGLLLFSDFLAILFFLLLLFSILSHINRQEEVSKEVIYGSIVGYLLLGTMWAFIYKILEGLQPGSFKIPDYGDFDIRSSMFYYSFTTLTTLGYGDVTPLTRPAKALAIMESVFGQMYIAVLIARLVGIHIAQKLTGKK